MLRDVQCQVCGRVPATVAEFNHFIVHPAIEGDYTAVRFENGRAVMEMGTVHCRCWLHSTGFPPRMTPEESDDEFDERRLAHHRDDLDDVDDDAQRCAGCGVNLDLDACQCGPAGPYIDGVWTGQNGRAA